MKQRLMVVRAAVRSAPLPAQAALALLAVLSVLALAAGEFTNFFFGLLLIVSDLQYRIVFFTLNIEREVSGALAAEVVRLHKKDRS